MRIKLQKLDEWNERRRQAARIYSSYLADFAEVKTPFVEDWAVSVWHLYVIKVKNRDQLSAHLKTENIETQIHYPIPPHLSDAYASEMKVTGFPVAEGISRSILSLPIGPHLDHEKIKLITKFCGEIIRK